MSRLSGARTVVGDVKIHATERPRTSRRLGSIERSAMHLKLVIDTIVRQTTVLIAQLATSAGMRAPLAQLANQTFLSLTRELERQGIAQKVIADMFGLALRSYQQKVQRLSESATDRGRTLWEALHDYLQQKRVASRAELLQRFARDDEGSVRGILSDMVEAGLAYRTGRAESTIYRVASAEEIARASASEESAQVAALLWVTIYQDGPLAQEELAKRWPLEPGKLHAALESLCDDGRIVCESAGATQVYRSDRCLIPLGQGAGWEAAVLDHYQAMVRSICAKLARKTTLAQAADRIGGSTYSFDIGPNHPYAERVYALLADHRQRLSALWDEVSQYNGAHSARHDGERVVFYFGQIVTSEAEPRESAEGERT